MDRVFSFEAEGRCSKTNHGFDAICVYFSDRHNISALEFYSDLESVLKSALVLPDCIVIIASEAFCEKIKGYWADDVLRNSFVKRGERSGVPFVKYYYVFSWSNKGLVEVLRQSSDLGVMPAIEVSAKKIVSQGLKYLVKRNNVVQIAPAGHIFKHPSGTRNNIFVQAREMAKTEPELCFVGRSIFLELNTPDLVDVSVVYIDSMGIYQFVREMLDFCNLRARIHSFHSYDELRKLSPPALGHLVIISASTSGGMARDLHYNQGFEEGRILTLIDKCREDRSGKVLIPLNEIDKTFFDFELDNFETEIELVGEHFSSKAKPPRAVTLGKPHTPPKLIKFLKNFGFDGLNKLNESISGEPKVLSVISEKVSSNKEFKKWLAEEVDWKVTVAIDTLVCTDDPGSIKIAKDVANLMSRNGRSTKKPAVHVYGKINWAKVADASGVLVITAVSRNGGLLREISRDLREYLNPLLNCPRHFLIGVGLPHSKESWIQLRQFLERNATERFYGFSEWLVLPVGSERRNDYWSDLSVLGSTAQTIQIENELVSQDVIDKSLDQVSPMIKANFNGFLPKINGDKLKLSAGFIYFGDVFKNKLHKALYATSYLAIAAAVQKARDLDDVAYQLRSTGYESVVLSPECFLRFNDNILHACLLRSCRKGELDYSSSPHHSKLMCEFLLKVFLRADLPYGAAAIEFAAALAINRVKLKKQDQEYLLEKVVGELKDSPSVLLGVLLMVGK